MSSSSAGSRKASPGKSFFGKLKSAFTKPKSVPTDVLFDYDQIKLSGDQIGADKDEPVSPKSTPSRRARAGLASARSAFALPSSDQEATREQFQPALIRIVKTGMPDEIHALTSLTEPQRALISDASLKLSGVRLALSPKLIAVFQRSNQVPGPVSPSRKPAAANELLL